MTLSLDAISNGVKKYQTNILLRKLFYLVHMPMVLIRMKVMLIY